MKTRNGNHFPIVSDRRFLLLKFQLDHVLASSDPVQITDKLACLPKDLTAAYQSVFSRMAPGDASFAYRILGWIFHAQRILNMSELQEALAIRIGRPSLQRHLIADPREIIRACGGLVNHDKDSDLVTFSHQTVRPFLEEHKLTSLPSHSVLCKTCLTYLQLPRLEKPCGRFAMIKRKEEFKFGEYAARFWSVHAVQSKREAEVETKVLETFYSDERREAMDEFLYGLCIKRKSLLHVLIERRLAFIFVSPSSSDEGAKRMYVSFCSCPNSKSRRSNLCGREYQR